MKPKERAMIYELNRLRSDPPRYAKLFIKKELDDALHDSSLRSPGSQYSVTTSYNDGVVKKDTIWLDPYQENWKALQSLYDTLLKLKPLSILQPDEGIYHACVKHAKDQAPTKTVDHLGTDGSWPWDRIAKFSPKMSTGNENIACGPDDVRSIVIQLLNDAGIEGYGHRYNMLDAKWTHAACFEVGKLGIDCIYWIQDFGAMKKTKNTN